DGPVDQQVEELVEAEQDGRDDEDGSQQCERLPRGVPLEDGCAGLCRDVAGCLSHDVPLLSLESVGGMRLLMAADVDFRTHRILLSRIIIFRIGYVHEPEPA